MTFGYSITANEEYMKTRTRIIGFIYLELLLTNRATVINRRIKVG